VRLAFSFSCKSSWLSRFNFFFRDPIFSFLHSLYASWGFFFFANWVLAILLDFYLHWVFCMLQTDHDVFFRCFLSNETKPVATIIKSMLQLALQFRSCFKSLGGLSESTVDQLNLHSLINFSQVFFRFHMQSSLVLRKNCVLYSRFIFQLQYANKRLLLLIWLSSLINFPSLSYCV
jgi:hypothetical protein